MNDPVWTVLTIFFWVHSDVCAPYTTHNTIYNNTLLGDRFFFFSIRRLVYSICSLRDSLTFAISLIYIYESTLESLIICITRSWPFSSALLSYHTFKYDAMDFFVVTHHMPSSSS